MVLRIPKSSSITGTSPSDRLVSYPWHSSDGGELTPLQRSSRYILQPQLTRQTWELALDFYPHLLPLEKGIVSKLGVWVPHLLSEKNKDDWMSIATSLLSRQRNGPFLKNIIKGYEIGSFMTMSNAKSSGMTKMNLCNLPKRQSFMEEKLCCVYVGITALLYIEFWNPKQTLSADLYSQQEKCASPQ